MTTQPAVPPTPRGRRAEQLAAGKIKLDRHVDAITRDQVKAYATAWQSTYDDLAGAAREAAEQAARLGRADVPAAYRTARLERSLDSLGRQLRELGQREGVRIGRLVGPAVDVPQQVLAALADDRGLSWNMPPEGALRAITGRTSQRIASELVTLSREAEAELRNTLVTAIGRGEGPRSAARRLLRDTDAATRAALDVTGALDTDGAQAIVGQARGTFAGGLVRANNLVRTELLDASRAATRESYMANGELVTGWRWLAATTSRTCPACWGMHNTVHDVDEVLEGHQQCRCTQVPILVGDDELDPVTGKPLDDVGDPDELLAAMPRADQLAVLGPKRHQLWEQGVSLRDMAQRQERPGWRPGRYVTPLRDLPPPPRGGRRAPAPPRPPVPPLPPSTGSDAPEYVQQVATIAARLPKDRAMIGRRVRTLEELADERADADYAVRSALDRSAALNRDVATIEREVARLRRKHGADHPDIPVLRADADKLAEQAARWDREAELRREEIREGLRVLRDSRVGSTSLDESLRGWDIAADGGPGAAAQEHLAAVKEAGAVLRRQLDEELTVARDAVARARREADDAYKAWTDTLSAEATERMRIDAEQAQRLFGRPYASSAAERRQLEELVDRLMRTNHQDLLDARAAAQAAKDATRRAAAEVAGRVGIDLRDTALRVLGRVRPFSDGRQLRLTVKGAAELETAMRHAERHYPRAWAERLTARAPLQVTSSQRGYHRRDHIALSADKAAQLPGGSVHDRVAIHELGHHAEQEVPGITALEWAYHWSRTSTITKGGRVRRGDNALHRLPNYPAAEKGRKDTYPEPYTGKEYGGQPTSFFEVLTTGMESLMAGSPYLDDDLLEWLMGVLATV